MEKEEDKLEKGKIVVVGEPSTVLGFKLAGVKVSEEVKDDVAEKFERHLESSDSSIIVINDSEFKKLPKKLQRRAEDSIQPVVVKVGGKTSPSATSDELNTLIKRAIGFDMLGEWNG